MSFLDNLNPFTGAITAIGKLADDALNAAFPTPEAKASAAAIQLKAQADAIVEQLTAARTVMLAEAQSADKWTSRARPSFLYVMYVMIMASIPMGVLYAFDPAHAAAIAKGLQQWLAALPDQLWSMMTYCYLGYTVARSGDKAGGLMNFVNGKKGA